MHKHAKVKLHADDIQHNISKVKVKVSRSRQTARKKSISPFKHTSYHIICNKTKHQEKVVLTEQHQIKIQTGRPLIFGSAVGLLLDGKCSLSYQRLKMIQYKSKP